MGFIAITIVLVLMAAAYWHFSKEEPQAKEFKEHQEE